MRIMQIVHIASSSLLKYVSSYPFDCDCQEKPRGNERQTQKIFGRQRIFKKFHTNPGKQENFANFFSCL